MCSQTVTSWGNPAGHGWVLPPPLSSWRLRLYRLHCLHGWWSLWLSHQCTLWGLWWLSHQCTLWGLWWLNHQCTLWGLAVCCFLEWEAWSLTLFCLLAILNSAFNKFSGRSVSLRRRNRFGYLSHSLVCLSSVSWHTLQYWIVCLTHPRLAKPNKQETFWKKTNTDTNKHSKHLKRI